MRFHDHAGAPARLWRLFWGEAEPPLRRRITATVALLCATALVNALVPLLFARAVDAMAPAHAAFAAPLAILLAYVGAQWLGRAMSELRCRPFPATSAAAPARRPG